MDELNPVVRSLLVAVEQYFVDEDEMLDGATGQERVGELEDQLPEYEIVIRQRIAAIL